MSQQLAFDLPHRPALDAEDFLVSDCNEAAVRLVDSWPSWPSPVHVIAGPAGSGKSHLANVWRLRSAAAAIAPQDITTAALEVLCTRPAIVLEDPDRSAPGEEDLFHLLNLCSERGVSLLMTARALPRDWAVTLPDLRSRLRSFPVVEIGPPDDDLLRAVLVKHFADRQLTITPRVVTYLAMRMERSMNAAASIVDAIDRAALKTGRKITRQFAGEVLRELSS